MNNITLKHLIIRLQDAKDDAKSCGFDHHFISEIDHIIATAKANLEENE